MLELKKVTKTYEVAGLKQKALNKIDIKFRENEFVSILGQSGSGKTTMLRDIVRLISNGNSYCKGMNVGVVDERSEIAACYMGVPQNDIGIRTDVIDNVTKRRISINLIRYKQRRKKKKKYCCIKKSWS